MRPSFREVNHKIVELGKDIIIPMCHAGLRSVPESVDGDCQ